MKFAKNIQQKSILFEKNKIIESYKTEFNELKTENKTSAVSTLHLVSQKTLDVPKKNNIQEKLVEPVFKKHFFFDQ